MEKYLTKTLSYIFHPLLMPTIGLIILFNTGTYVSYMQFEAKKFIILVVFLSTFVFPLIFLPFFLYRNLIKSIKLEERKERYYPFVLTLIFYFAAYYILNVFPIPQIILSYIFGSFISVLILFIVTLKWKISAHMIGIGGLIGMLLSVSIKFSIDLQFYIMLSFFVAGLIAYSRLYLKTHTSYQIYLGLLSGFIIISTCIFVL